MITINRWKDGDFYMSWLERHAAELVVVLYRSHIGANLGKATTAIHRHEPTLADLHRAAASILGLTPEARFRCRGSITAVATYSEDRSGTPIEHYNFFNQNFEEASGQELKEFLTLYME